jgi:hypothetical protein
MPPKPSQATRVVVRTEAVRPQGHEAMGNGGAVEPHHHTKQNDAVTFEFDNTITV